MQLSRFKKTKSANISAPSLHTFSKDVGIFCWFIWLQKVNLFKNSFFFNNDKLNSELEVQFSLVALTLRWVLYIRKALMTGLLIFPGVEPTKLYCGMLRLLTLIEKNYPKLWQLLYQSLWFYHCEIFIQNNLI